MSGSPEKVYYFIAVVIGSYGGSFIASLFGAGYFSVWGLLANGVGAIIAILIVYKLTS